MKSATIGAVALAMSFVAVEASAQVVPSAPSNASAQRVPRSPWGPTRSAGDLNPRAYTAYSLGDRPGELAEQYSLAQTTARCIVGIGGSDAASLLGGDLTDDPQYQGVRTAVWREYRTCSRGGRVAPLMLNYAIAEQLVLRAGSAGLEDRASFVNMDEAEAFYGSFEGEVTLVKVARCVSVFSPGLAYKVLETPVRSEAEAAALDTLYRSTPECGVSNAPSDVGRAFERGAVADALYHWTQREG